MVIYADYIKRISWRGEKDLIWSKKVKNPHNWKENIFSWKHGYPFIFVNLIRPNIYMHKHSKPQGHTPLLQKTLEKFQFFFKEVQPWFTRSKPSPPKPSILASSWRSQGSSLSVSQAKSCPESLLQASPDFGKTWFRNFANACYKLIFIPYSCYYHWLWAFWRLSCKVQGQEL